MMENNLINKELLIKYKTELESLPLWESIKDLEESDKRSELYCISLTSKKIENCFKLLEQGIPITEQLAEIKMDTEDYWYCEEYDKTPTDMSITDLIELFKQFNFGNYQEELEHFIKQNTGWHNMNRDFEIYNKIKGGALNTELADELNCHYSTISKIKSKVQNSINNLKGRLFEIEYEKYLKSLDVFKNCKIVRDGRPSQTDIYIIDNIKKELYVFSLKNLELKKSHTIMKDKLKPELQFAYNNTFKKIKIMLYLIVFDSLTEQLYIKELDYTNPSNIIIHR